MLLVLKRNLIETLCLSLRMYQTPFLSSDVDCEKLNDALTRSRNVIIKILYIIKRRGKGKL